MLDDFVAAFDPLWIEVRGEFHVRGGISSVVVAQSTRAERPPNR
jgi:NADPH-dependent 7-cyano-7-deazaguanine reductase QueF